MGTGHLAWLAHAIAHQNPAAVVAERGGTGGDRGRARGEDGAVIEGEGIVAAAVGVLVGEGVAVAGVEGDVLGSALKGGAEAEQLAVRSPTGAFLGLFADVAQVGNGFLAKHPAVFDRVDQRVHQAVEALGADDVEVAGELFAGADAPAQEMAEGQLHGPAVGEAPVELLAILLAVAQGADELPHRELALAHLGGFHRADHLGIALDDVAFKHLAVGGAHHLGLLGAGEHLAHDEALGALGGQGVGCRQLQALVFGAAQALAGRRRGHVQFLDQHVEAVDHQLAGFRQILEQVSGGGAHLLQGHVGGGQGAALFEHIPQAAGVHGQDAGIARNHGVAHVAQEPGQVANRFLHPLGPVDPDADGVEARRQHDAHIGIAASPFQQARDQVAAAGCAAGEGLN